MAGEQGGGRDTVAFSTAQPIEAPLCTADVPPRCCILFRMHPCCMVAIEHVLSM